MGKRLYVGNLPFDCDEASLRAAFAADGRPVERVHIVLDRETNRPRGFAFVEMATDEAAKQALAAMNGRIFGGRSLRVSEAEDRRPGMAGTGPRSGPAPRDRAGSDRDGPDRGGADRGGGDRGGPDRGAVDGGGHPPGGGPRPKPWELGPSYGPAPRAPARREPERKPAPRRRHDDDPDFGGRRGARRFDDDDDEG